MNAGLKTSLFGCSLFGIALSLSAPAYAQAPAGSPSTDPQPTQDAGEVGLSDIVVTARQRNENLQDVPISITAISGDDLKTFNMGMSSELQNYVPNLTINGAYGSSNPQIFIRGVGNNDYNDNAGAAVGVYLDGVFLNAPAGKLLQMFDLEGVQVLRGPQGTLFGKNNTAGAILFNTTKPGDRLEGYATVTAGNYGQRDLEGAVTVPIAANFSARVSLSRSVSTGWGENRNAANQKVDDIGGVDQYAARLVLRWNPADTDILLNINRAQTDDDRLPGRQVGASPTGADDAGFINPSNDVRVNYSNYKEIEKVRTDGIFLSVSHKFSSLNLTSITAFWDSTRFVTLDVDKSPNSVLHLSRNPKAKQFSQEVRLSSDDNENFKWVVGATYLRENLRSVNLWAFGLPDPATANAPQIYTNRSVTKAAFAEADIKLNDMFSITVGGRYSIDDRDFAMDFPFVGIVDQVRSRTDKRFAGRIILDQKITDDVMLYYSVSRGFQGGGYNGGAFSTVEIGDGYSPETLTAYEFGWKSFLFDKRIKLNGSVFYYDYKDIQVFSLAADQNGGFSQFITNAKGGRLFGLDLDAQAVITQEFKVGVGLGLLDSKYKDSTLALNGYSGASFPANGNPFISAPKIDLKLFADYVAPLGTNELSLHADYSYRGKRNFDITGRPDVSGQAYGLLNGRIGFGPSDKAWNVSLWGKNILNKTYKSFVADLSGFAGFYETYYGAPRQYGLQASVKF